MGLWLIGTDTLARSRFLVSPFAETFACLKLLHAGTAAHPGEEAWLRAHLPGYRAFLAADPVAGPLIDAALRSWIADFVCPTPCAGESFEETVARVRAADPAAARANLRVSLAGLPLPALLDRGDLPERATALLTYVWEEAVRPYWGRRRRILEADVVARTAQVSHGGWAAVLDSLRPWTRWLGENRFQVNLHEYPPREIASGAGLAFVPVTTGNGWVSWEGRERYAVVYPCLGVLAEDHARRPVPAGLGPLIGAARADVLMLLGSPMSTTQLVAVTGQGLGSVGRHLRVLLDAGLVERRRAGRSVLYERTAAGTVLVEASRRLDARPGPSS